MGVLEDLDNKTEAIHVETHENVPLEELDTIEETRTGSFAWLVSITAALGGLLFGYDTGIISAVLVFTSDSDAGTARKGESRVQGQG